MASGGWLGHTISKAWHGVTGVVKKTVSAVTNGVFGGYPKITVRESVQPTDTPTSVAPAAPAPTMAEQAEYDVAIRNREKKRGKNSLFVSSSAGSSGGGSGINL